MRRSLRRAAIAVSLVLLGSAAAADAQGRVPTIDDLLTLRSVGSARISPDGRWVAYVETDTDWKADAFVGQLWVANIATGERRQLSRHEKGISNPEWSPDGGWLAFTSSRDDNRAQIFAMRPDGGEAIRLTKNETSVQGFAWSPDGKQIAFTAVEPEPAGHKARVARLGAFDVVRREYNYVHLSTVAVAAALEAPQAGRARTRGTAYSVNGFDWAPDGRRIAFSATRNPDLIQGHTADLYVVTLAADSAGADPVRAIVTQPGADNAPEWSPDGTQIAFVSAMGISRAFAKNTRIAVVSAEGGAVRSVTDGIDETVGLIRWTPRGIFAAASQKTAAHLFLVDPRAATARRVSAPDSAMISGVSVTPDGSTAAFTIGSPTALPEIAVSATEGWNAKRLTAATTQIAGWRLGSREVFRWTSKDGAPIEGVLIKPADFDPAKKYPLLCVIHGGPTGTDRPALPDARYYPVDLWAARGALILKVNYRGSAGYGEKFRELNVRNLGVGDAWDVLSGVDALMAKGWVDATRVASMGWSQGGYISAFLTTSTTRFAAISVGAGISDWSTYYYNTDITPFTINYLGDNPVMDPAIYAKTSPITYVKGAKTPTLIQHGELDRRVPIANAYELRQALEDRGVPVEMVVYSGYGHGITKPKSQRAVMEHNYRWFNHWIFGDPAPDFTAEVVPAQRP